MGLVMRLHSLFVVVGCVKVMRVREVRMMRRFFMMTGV